VSVDELGNRPALLRSLLGALRRTVTQHTFFSQAVAAQLGVGTTDLDCLLQLHDFGPATAGQLAEVLGLTTGAVTGVIDRLVGAGYVVRDTDPSDRRRVIVRPVDERMLRLDEIYAPLVALLERALDPVSESTLSMLLYFQQRAGAAMEQETARLRAQQASGTGGAATFTAPLGELDSASLEFATGASEVRIFAAAADTDELYRATFEGIQPSLRAQSGVVTVRYKRVGLFEWGSRHSGTVALNPGIPWSIALKGGASGVDLDARGLELRGLRLDGGASKLDLWLPSPRGSVTICIEGGVNRAQIQRPDGVPLQLQVQGGANRLEFDAQRFGAVGGELRLASPGWELATGRYMVEVRGGASRLTVTEAT
jgi:DNA-binding MarR family transcriptional regulator